MAKDTILNEDAEIYTQRNKAVSEKQKLKDMTMKEKIRYFNDYYRNKSIVAIISIAIFISIVYTIFSPKTEVVFNAAIINDYLDEESVNQLTNNFAKFAHIDTKTEEILIDSSYLLSEDTSELSMASGQKLTTYIFAGDIDVIITDEEQFQKLVKREYFDNLSDQLPTDLYSSLSNSFFVANEPEGSSINAYGIYLDSSKVYQNTGTIIKKPVIGIVSNSQHKRNSAEFIRYLFGMVQ